VPPLHLFLFAVFLLFTTMTFASVHPFEEMFTGMAEGGQSSNGWVAEQLAKIGKNPQYYGYKAESLSYKLALLIVPLSMMLLAVLTVFKRGYSLYDHGVVALYGLGFAGLLTALLTIVGPLTSLDVEVIGVAALVAHAVLHLRGAYRMSWFGAVARAAFLGVSSLLVFVLFLLLVIGLSTA
jgi:hypothetical protein